jgi:hypothetical protein
LRQLLNYAVKLTDMTRKNSISRLLILVLCLFTGSMYAQDASQAAFNSAVDQINCETIRFIHREAGRAEIANNMQCTSFESIAQTVPEDEAKTTGQLAKDIEAFKTKFKADKPLAEQLDAVIAFADKKITAKKRKGNVDDFKAKLEGYKSDAIANANGGGSNSSSSASSSKPEKHNETATANDTGKAIVEPAGSAGSSKKKDWLGVIGVLLGLVSLAFAIPAYMATRKLKSGAISASSSSGDDGMNVSRPIDEASYRRLETRMQQEISNLRRSFEEQLATVTASTGYTEPEAMTVKEEPKKEPEVKETPAASSTFSSYTSSASTAPVMETKIEEKENVLKEDKQQYESVDQGAKTDEAPSEEYNKSTEEINQNTSFATPEPTEATVVEDTHIDQSATVPVEQHNSFEEEAEEEPVHQPAEPTMSNNFRGAYTSSTQPQTATEEAGSKLEEAEAMPIYRYVGLPEADGTFSENAFKDSPDKDSIFEIEMYEDVPNKAFFSLLPYPEIVKSALQQPETYLQPCCLYTDDPSGKNTIILLEEGMLRKQEGKWHVYEKARVRFE